MMMRFAAYVGTSIVLAMGVAIRALHQRANFYSASVYVAQSNACLMILTNLVLLGLSVLMITLQRLAYGELRVIEIESLYEKAWFAITETCLAMTIFREEVGWGFLVMFVLLLAGKVWGWLGEGRLEILEQQPPSNPRLFHLRLSSSLALSVLFDTFMLRYSIQKIREQAEPNMMVMFSFEFAVLSVASLSSAARYAIYMHERAVINEQTRLRRQERLASNHHQLPDTRASSLPSHEAAALPLNPGQVESNEVEDEEFDVPGWETKGFWVFYLDLITDFLKLVLYLSFFGVLCIFYGMPLHIIRDVAITIRSFYKRIHDFLRYRQATKDMNERYADATREDMAREDVCIICRETMRVWTEDAETAAAQQSLRLQDQRLRPKRLPCGHILHFACLRSWLERQQNCPTCRRPVLNTSSLIRVPQTRARDRHQPPPGPIAQENLAPAINDTRPQPHQNRVRYFNLGPIRLGFGAGQDLQGLANHMNRNERQLHPDQPSSANHNNPNSHRTQQTIDIAATQSADSIQRQLQAIEQQLMQQIRSLQAQADQLYLVRTLQGELARIRINSQNSSLRPSGFEAFSNRPSVSSVHGQTLGSQPFGEASQSFSAGEIPRNLPHGLTLPDGWSLLPLRRVVDGPSGPINNLNNDNPSLRTGLLQTGQPSQSSHQSIRNSEGYLSRIVSTPSSGLGEGHSATLATALVSPIGESVSSSTHIARESLHNNSTQIESSSTIPKTSASGSPRAGDVDVHSTRVTGNSQATSSGLGARSKHAMVEDQDDDDDLT